jgi:hypothetical protein
MARALGSIVVTAVAAVACGEHPPPAAPPPTTAASPAPIDAAAPPPIDAAAAPVGFAAPGSGGLPDGWRGTPAGAVAIDDAMTHDGRRAVRLALGSNGFAALSSHAALDAAGTTLELHGYLRTRDVHGFAGLWLREDGDAGVVEFDNMAKRQLAGTTEWTPYAIQLPLNPGATQIVWGALLAGDGSAWAADLELFVDGKPIAQAPRVQRTPTALDKDHEFDHGSRVAPGRATAAQVANLVTLAKVWGFLKYHHPVVTGGGRHWDYELLRVLPARAHCS